MAVNKDTITAEPSSPPSSVLFKTNSTLSDIAWGWVKPHMPWVVIITVVIAGLIGVVAVLTGGFSTVTLQLFFTLALVICFSFLSLYDAEVSARRSSLFALLSVLVNVYIAIIGFLKFWLPDWKPAEDWESIWRGFGEWILIVIIARVVLLHVHLLLAEVIKFRTSVVEFVAKCAVFLIAALGIMLSIPVIANQWTPDELYWRAVAAVAILDVLATLLIPLIHRLFFKDQAKNQYQQTAAQFGGQVIQPPKGSVVFANFQNAPKNALRWPVLADGTPLPNKGGLPDFSLVARNMQGAFLFIPLGQQTSIPNALQWPVTQSGEYLQPDVNGQPDFANVARW